jgi:hypothetical protein
VVGFTTIRLLISINKTRDVILKINLDVETELIKNLRYQSGSNKISKSKNTYYRIFNGLENTATLTIERNGVIEQMKVSRYDFKDFNYWNSTKRVKSKSS